MAYPAQGSSVSFDGGTIGQLVGITVTPATAVVQDSTNYDSDIVGSSWDSRVLKTVNCTAIEPGTASITMLGSPGFSWSDVGHKGTLVVEAATETLSFEAVLMKFEIQASVGELVKWSAEFRYTGS